MPYKVSDTTFASSTTRKTYLSSHSRLNHSRISLVISLYNGEYINSYLLQDFSDNDLTEISFVSISGIFLPKMLRILRTTVILSRVFNFTWHGSINLIN